LNILKEVDMTKKELVDELNKYPDDSVVLIPCDTGQIEIYSKDNVHKRKELGSIDNIPDEYDYKQWQ
jgi:hypothetical protein